MTYFLLLIMVIFACFGIIQKIGNCRYGWVNHPLVTLKLSSRRDKMVPVTLGGMAMFAIVLVSIVIVPSPLYWEFSGGNEAVFLIDEKGVIHDSSSGFGAPDVP